MMFASLCFSLETEVESDAFAEERLLPGDTHHSFFTG